jgi:hypothetical protein
MQMNGTTREVVVATTREALQISAIVPSFTSTIAEEHCLSTTQNVEEIGAVFC